MNSTGQDRTEAQNNFGSNVNRGSWDCKLCVADSGHIKKQAFPSIGCRSNGRGIVKDDFKLWTKKKVNERNCIENTSSNFVCLREMCHRSQEREEFQRGVLLVSSP